MGLLKSRKNKKFNYNPRYFDDKGEGNPYHLEQKFDKFRTTVGDNVGLKGKFKSAWGELRNTSDRNTKRRMLIIVSILVLLFLFIIDFDLSIFFQK